MATVDLEETLFPFDLAEYEAWCRGDRQVIDSLVERSGTLGRSPGTYRNQAGTMGQNYPEVRYAVHLVEEEHVLREDVVYENYTLSARILAKWKAKSTLKATGAKMLAAILSDAFFAEFDRLYDCNRTRLKKLHEDMLVDLFAIDRTRRRVLFAEVKKYDETLAKTEVFQEHQRLTLAFLRWIADSMGPSCSREPGWGLKTRLVAFLPRAAFVERRVAPRRYTVDFEA